MESNAYNAQQETEAEDTVTGVLQEYMAGILDKIKQQIDWHGHPDCYTHGTFWECPKYPIFALEASATCPTGISPTELYHLDVFIWLPDHIPGSPGHFHCSCSHHHNLSCNGWNEKPIARWVKHLCHDYLLLTNHWICNKRQGGCGKSFEGTDPYILSQLPHHYQEAFLAILTIHAAVDNNFYLSCALALPPALVQSHFQPQCKRCIILTMPTGNFSTLLQLPHLPNFTIPGHTLSLQTKINMQAPHHQSNTAKQCLWIGCVHTGHTLIELLLHCQPLVKGDHTFGVCNYLPFFKINIWD